MHIQPYTNDKMLSTKHTFSHTNTPTYTGIHEHAHAYVLKHTCVHSYVCVQCMLIYRITHIHIYMLTPSVSPPLPYFMKPQTSGKLEHLTLFHVSLCFVSQHVLYLRSACCSRFDKLMPSTSSGRMQGGLCGPEIAELSVT